LALAATPFALVLAGDRPPLAPLVGGDLLGISCAEESVAGRPVCQEWRRKYDEWEARQRGGARPPAGPSPVPGAPATGKTCLAADAAQSTECQQWLRDIVDWYRRQKARQEITRLEDDVRRAEAARRAADKSSAEQCTDTGNAVRDTVGKPVNSRCETYEDKVKRLASARASFAERWGTAPPPPAVVSEVAPEDPMQRGSQLYISTCFDVSVADDPVCQKYFTELEAWQQRQNAAAVASNEARASNGRVGEAEKRSLSGDEIRSLLAGRVADGLWIGGAWTNGEFVWRFEGNGTLRVSGGGSNEGNIGSGDGTWRVETDTLCLRYSTFVASKSAATPDRCYRVVQDGERLSLLDENKEIYAWFVLSSRIADQPPPPKPGGGGLTGPARVGSPSNDPPPPGGVTELAEKICLVPEVLNSEECQDWARELKAWERREQARQEVARLEAETRKIGARPGFLGYSLDQVCAGGVWPTLGGYEVRGCAEYNAAAAKLRAARAVLREAIETAIVAREAVVDEAEAFLVIVNARNRYLANAAEMKARVRALYLGDQKAWPGAVAGKPFGRPGGTPVQSAFMAAVLDMSPKELAAHWQGRRSAEGAPPAEVDSARDLLQQVASEAGAFGVVTADEAKRLPAMVRVLFRFGPEG
jgi:hypothetical protein